MLSVRSHCQVPCGIFDDPARVAALKEDAATVRKAMVQINELSSDSSPLAFNQVLNALVGQAIGSGNKMMAGTWLQLSVFFLALSYLPMMALQYFFVADAVRHTASNPSLADESSQGSRHACYSRARASPCAAAPPRLRSGRVRPGGILRQVEPLLADP